MSKLSGKKAFYAMGQSDRAKGINVPQKKISQFPDGSWAVKAYVNGWFGWGL